MSGLKPDSRLPATTATTPVSASASDGVGDGRQRLSGEHLAAVEERVRIVFSVPLWSSEAMMSPATSAVISGNSQIEPNSSSTSGTARPDSRT